MATRGNTSTIFIPRGTEPPKPVEAGRNYFVVKIHTAQAAFTGPFYERVNSLLVASSISMNHPALGNEPIKALQFSRNVKKDTPEKLGISKNLINCVPAIMGYVTISIDFILDKENRMANLSKLVNAGAFVTSLSFGPGAATAAKTVSEISQKLIDTFIPNPKQRDPILQFIGDFNIPAGELKDGFYAILASRDLKKPLPDASSTFEVKDSDLFVDGKPAADWSYVILNVYSIDSRSRDLNEGAAWERKLREAEGIADLIELDPFAKPEEKERAWEKCKTLIRDASTLLLNDDNYLRDEAVQTYTNSGKYCSKKILGDETRLVKASRVAKSKQIKQEREFLGIPLDEDLEIALNRYERQVDETKRLIREEKLI